MVLIAALRGFLTPLTLPLAAAAQEPLRQDLGGSLAAPPAPVVIYTAKQIVTLDPARPSVAAVAVADNYRLKGLGAERADAMVRMGDGERADSSYSYHSDMPIAPGQSRVPVLLVRCER